MGEVYRARDLRLRRVVALWITPEGRTVAPSAGGLPNCGNPSHVTLFYG